MSNENKINVPDFDFIPNDPSIDNTPHIEYDPTMGGGYEPSEQKRRIEDPNSIHVQISAKRLPVVLLFGPRSCGKTMALIRLARFLKKKGYSVEPDRSFRPSDSEEYQEVCDEFKRNINSQVAAASTNNTNFLLIKVSKGGRPICQFLEAPGEHYFDEKHPQEPFPAYIHTLLNSDMPRIWIFILEKDWADLGVEGDYADKIADMMSMLSGKDRKILLFPKADKYPALYNKGIPQTDLFFDNIREDYETILNRLDRPSFFNLYQRTFEFVPFSSGVYSKRSDGGQSFIESNDMYPERLWEAILRSLKN